MTRVWPPSRKQRLSFRLALYILTGTPMVFLVAFGYNYHYSKQLVLKNVQENAADLVVLDRNILEVPANEISRSRVSLTMFQGKAIHRCHEPGSPSFHWASVGSSRVGSIEK